MWSLVPLIWRELEGRSRACGQQHKATARPALEASAPDVKKEMPFVLQISWHITLAMKAALTLQMSPSKALLHLAELF